MADEKKVEFPAPKGFLLPEGVGKGDDFDIVCTVRVKEDGTLCLTKLGDTPMPGYGEKAKGKQANDYSGLAESMQAERPMQERPVENQEGMY